MRKTRTLRAILIILIAGLLPAQTFGSNPATFNQGDDPVLSENKTKTGIGPGYAPVLDLTKPESTGTFSRMQEPALQQKAGLTFTVVNTDDSGVGSLRWAIEEANASAGKDIIAFDIPGPGPHVITPATSFVSFTQPVIVDGTTQLAQDGSPLIVLDGSNTPLGTNGLVFTGSAGDSEVLGLSIVGYARLQEFPFSGGYGIYLISSNNKIEGNYIGLLPDGTPKGNTRGVVILGSNNTVGGTQSGQRNVISANTTSGIDHSGASATGNVVEGNFLGTDPTGTQAIGNRFNVQYYSGANNNLLGGTNPASRNIISGGIFLNAENNPTDGTGVSIANAGTTGNVIIGNYIGTDVTGTQALPNWRAGVLIIFGASGNIVGQPGNGNVISGNDLAGVYFQGSAANPSFENLVQSNLIGLQADGLSPLPNGYGLDFVGRAENNLVGGTTPDVFNTIASNISRGAMLRSTVETVDDDPVTLNPAGNSILGNSIFSNGVWGIVLGPGDIVPNDADDSDTGPNKLQNHPVMSLTEYFEVQEELEVTYHVPSDPAYSAYPLRVEFFATNPGERQGKTFLGFDEFTAVDFGNGGKTATIPVPPAAGFSAGDQVTATATDADGNTSQFGIIVTSEPGVIIAEYTLSIDIVGSGSVTVNGSPYTGPLDLTEGTEVELEATAGFLHAFEGWSGDLAGIQSPISLTMDGNKEVTATFAVIENIIAFWDFEDPGKRALVTSTETLVNYTADQGEGTIALVGPNFTSWVQGIDGSGTFAPNSNGWNDGSGTKYWQVTINTLGYEDVELFSYQQSSATGPRDFQIQFSLDGSSWTDVPGGEATVANNFVSGAVENLLLPEAVNHQEVVHIRWVLASNTSVGGGDIGSAGTNRIDNILLLGNPAEPPVVTYTITAAAIVVEGGTIEVNGEPYTDPVEVEEGETVTLEAIAATGYKFVNWTEDDVEISDEPVIEFTATADRSLVANFELLTYVITASAGPGGSISPMGEIVVDHGGSQEFLIEADPGFEILDVLVDQVSVGAVPSYNFADVTQDHEIEALFQEVVVEPETFTITATADPVEGGTIEANGEPYTDPVEVEDGETVTLVAIPAVGWEFLFWSENTINLGTDETLEFTAEGDRNLVAHFAQEDIPVAFGFQAFIIEGEGSIFVNDELYTGELFFPNGTIITVEAVPADGWEFSHWESDLSGTDPLQELLMDSPKEVFAYFTQPTEPEFFELILLAEPEEGGEVFGAGIYEVGEDVAVLAVANPGYVFLYWTYEGQELVFGEGFNFEMFAENITLTAHFEEEEIDDPDDPDPVFGECSYSQGYWFARPQTVWPHDVTIGGHIFTQEEGKAFWPSNTNTKRAFTQYATIVLSGVDLSLFPDLAEAMAVIEDYFANLYPDAAPRQVNQAAGYIGDWVDQNHCDTEDEQQGLLAGGDKSGDSQDDGSSIIRVMAYPNPFADHVNLNLVLDEDSFVRVEVFNMLGNRVTVLYEGQLEGHHMHELRFNAGNLPRGIYFFRIQAGDGIRMERIVKGR